MENKTSKAALDAQKHHWNSMFLENEDMFGTDASEPAKKALAFFEKKGVKNILELGAGQGRDAIFFAQNGIDVTVADYSKNGLLEIEKKAKKLGLSSLIHTVHHDAREPLPFEENAFDGCFSHMFYCMALSEKELIFITSEIRRVLKTSGYNIYTARNKNDSHFEKGNHYGDDLYEFSDFIIHFFDEEKIKILSDGFEILETSEFLEGELPRVLYYVSLQKK